MKMVKNYKPIQVVGIVSVYDNIIFRLMSLTTVARSRPLATSAAPAGQTTDQRQQLPSASKMSPRIRR